jgi:hypothetical protein
MATEPHMEVERYMKTSVIDVASVSTILVSFSSSGGLTGIFPEMWGLARKFL